MADIIPAVSRKVETMADGTLRIKIDIEPMYARDAFELFGAPNSSMALAALTQEAAQEQAQKDFEEEVRPKGGRLCRDAVLTCKEPNFWEWMASQGSTFPYNEAGARDFILSVCLIESRSELDHNNHAARIFKQVHRSYSEWANG